MVSICHGYSMRQLYNDLEYRCVLIENKAFGDTRLGQAIVADLFDVHKPYDCSVRYNDLRKYRSAMIILDD